MKKLSSSIVFNVFFCVFLFGQVPNSFNYQAVLRDADGQIMGNETVTMRYSIVESADCDGNGTVIFRESHQDLTTTQFGLVNSQIGNGVADVGSFEDIDWSINCYFLWVEVSVIPNTFTSLGTQPFNAVPYALYAKSSGNSADDDADPTNEIQVLNLNGTQLSISDGNQIDLAPIIPPGGTDDQQLTLNGTTLGIEDGNTVDLSPLQDGVNDADADPTNEIQDITFNPNTNELTISSGSTVMLPSGGTDADADPTNEIQVLDLNGTQLSISDGNQIDLEPIIPSGGTDDQQLTLNGTTLTIEDGNTVDLSPLQDGVNDADADPTNEIQDITFNPNTNELTISSGSTVMLPSGGTDADADPTNEIQVLGLNGTELSISDGNQIDLAPIIPSGGTDDQQLTLNGTTLTIEDGNTVDLSSLQDGVNDADADPTNEIQVLGLNGTELSISDGNQIDLEPIIPSGGTDDQQLTLNGTTLGIEDGNTVDLSSLQDGVNDADADPTNEIQVLGLNGTELSISDGNQIDLEPIIPSGGTDDQQLTLNGTTLGIEDGNTVDLSSLQDGVNDADADPTNEIQVLGLNGTELSISDGNQIDLEPIIPSGGTDDQQLTLNGTTLGIEDGNTVDLSPLQDGVNDADADPTNEIETWSTLQGIPADIADGDDTADADADPDNELQALSLNGNLLSLSPASGGSSPVNLSGLGSVWNQSSSGINYTAGKVGIGLASPDAGLYILRGGSPTDDVPALVVNKQGGQEAIAVFKNDNEERMRIYRSGVGIGTPAIPNYGTQGSLEILSGNPGNDVPALVVTKTVGQEAIAVFKNDNEERMRIYRSGVGIGTPAIPNYDTKGSMEIVGGGNNLPGLTVRKEGGSSDERIVLFSSGTNNDTGVLTETFAVTRDNRTKVMILEITGGSDFAESFEVNETKNFIAPEPGMVVSIDPDNPGELEVSAEPYDKKIAGIISGANGVKTGMLMGQKASIADGDFPVALSGRVYVYADASSGAIQPGDFLTSSAKPGFAMKATDIEKRQGAILGKAMTGLDEGEGFVLVLVSLQ